MNSELYARVVSDLIPHLVKFAKSTGHDAYVNSYADKDKGTLLGHRDWYLDHGQIHKVTLSFSHYSRMFKSPFLKAIHAGDIRSCIILFCRGAVDHTEYDDLHRTITLHLVEGKVRLTADGRVLRLDTKDYKAVNYGHVSFNVQDKP